MSLDKIWKMRFKTGIKKKTIKHFIRYPPFANNNNDNNKLEFLLENEKKWDPGGFEIQMDPNVQVRISDGIFKNKDEKKKWYISDFAERKVNLNESEIFDMGGGNSYASILRNTWIKPEKLSKNVEGTENLRKDTKYQK